MWHLFGCHELELRELQLGQHTVSQLWCVRRRVPKHRNLLGHGRIDRHVPRVRFDVPNMQWARQRRLCELPCDGHPLL